MPSTSSTGSSARSTETTDTHTGPSNRARGYYAYVQQQPVPRERWVKLLAGGFALPIVGGILLGADFLFFLSPVAAVLVGIAVLIRWSNRRKQHRRAGSVPQWAARHGMTYTADGGRPEWLHQLPEARPWSVGALLTGLVDGREVRLADCWYPRDSPRGADRERRLAAVVELGRDLPDITVATRAAHSWWPWWRSNAVGFTGDKVFDSWYEVTTADPDAARTLLGDDLRYDLTEGLLPAWQVHGSTLLAYWSPSATLSADTLDQRLAELLRLTDLVENPSQPDDDTVSAAPRYEG
jgi:hypothetical protein